MSEIETRRVLYSLVQLLRDQTQYLLGLHQSTIALFDILREKNPELETLYKQHPLVRAQREQSLDADLIFATLTQ